MAWAGRSPATADSQHLIVKSCWKISSPENVTLCTSRNTLFSWCCEASKVSQSPTLGVRLHTRVVADAFSNTITSSLSQRFMKDRNSSSSETYICSQEIHKPASSSSLVDPSFERWDGGKGYLGRSLVLYMHSPARNWKRILLFCSDWSCLIYIKQNLQNSGSGLVWQNKKQPTVASFFALGHNLFSYLVVETSENVYQRCYRRPWVGSKPMCKTGCLLWWPISAAVCLCWGEHVTHLSSTHTLPLVSSNDLLTLKLS